VKRDATPTGSVRPEELAFIFRSGRLCLALCATVGERWRRNFERLTTPADLARWYTGAGLLDTAIRVTPAGLDQARTVREAIYRSAKNIIAGHFPDRADEEIINTAAAVPTLTPRMHHGAVSLAPAGAAAEAAALSAVARDAIDLFTTPLRGRVRECAASTCGLLFVDLSRPGRRRWCASTACGTKARSAAYRRRYAPPARADGRAR
jgi:predicted RNA-binding Zn ribbon-like protein